MRVAGIKAVANDIEVKLSGIYGRNDTELAEAVLNALRWDVLVPEDKIQVK